jgi:hypothetical protein
MDIEQERKENSEREENQQVGKALDSLIDMTSEIFITKSKLLNYLDSCGQNSRVTSKKHIINLLFFFIAVMIIIG